jgi:hypothetical protein
VDGFGFEIVEMRRLGGQVMLRFAGVIAARVQEHIARARQSRKNFGASKIG